MKYFDVIVVGGGLAGLTAGIDLARRGIKVGLFEKKKFPHHKVCGEYLSLEVLPYLKQLDVHLEELGGKHISRLRMSTPSGKLIEADLPLGGLGISRFCLDHRLWQVAKDAGVDVIQEKVIEISYQSSSFALSTRKKNYSSDYVLGAFGKRSSLDRKLKRSFFDKPSPWVALKSHYRTEHFKDDLVELHNFRGGYCGLSKTQENEVNLCYLSTYQRFREFKDPQDFEKEVLRTNPFLDNFLSGATRVFEQPLSIAQISFRRKSPVESHVLMLGDAASLIHPLCGNGMAMAIQSAKMAVDTLMKYWHQNQRQTVEREYARRWKNSFSTRLTTGKWLQKILMQESTADFAQYLITKIPGVLPQIIKRTHGKPVI